MVFATHLDVVPGGPLIFGISPKQAKEHILLKFLSPPDFFTKETDIEVRVEVFIDGLPTGNTGERKLFEFQVGNYRAIVALDDYMLCLLVIFYLFL